MSTQVTWPGGSSDTPPAAWSVPAAGDLNWSSLSGFLLALGASAQCTTFQKFGIRVAVSTPVTVSTTDCVVCTNLTVSGAVAVTLPSGSNKQMFIISDDKGDAATNNITISAGAGQTIGGSATFVLNGNRDSVMIVFHSDTLDWKIVIFAHH